ERPLLARSRPDRGKPTTVDDVHSLVEGESEARKCRARRDLVDSRLGDPLLSGELQERRVAFPLLPGAELRRAHIFNEVALVYGHARRLDPLVVRRLAVPEVLHALLTDHRTRVLRHGSPFPLVAGRPSIALLSRAQQPN